MLAEILGEAAPYLLLLPLISIMKHFDERRNFRRYEQWRLNESKRRLESIR